MEIQQGEILLVAGSQILPWGKQSNDYDLLLLTPSISPTLRQRQADERLQEQSRNKYLLCYFDTPIGELDVEVWPSSTVNKAIADLGTGLPTVEEIERSFPYFAGLDRKVGVDLFHSLLCGQPSPRSASLHTSLLQRVDRTRYFAWNRDYCLSNVRDGLKGIRQSLKGNFFEEAHLKMCWALDNAVDALLFDNGYSINRWKWRLRYLQFLSSDVSSMYREVRLGPAPSDEEPYRARLRFLETCVARISMPIEEMKKHVNSERSF